MPQRSDNLGDAIAKNKYRARLLWLDIARTAALGGMIVFHAVRDLEFFSLIPPGTTLDGFWAIFARLVAASFLFLSGISLFLAHGNGLRLMAWARRLGVVVGAAALVSLATYIAVPNVWIKFGILHAIAAASIVGLAFLRVPPLATAFSAVIALFVWIVWGRSFDLPSWTAWTGLKANVSASLDYIPLVPWLAPFLIGMAFAQAVDPVQLEPRWSKTPSPLLTLPGRYSLLVYLVHQPILLAVLAAYSWLSA